MAAASTADPVGRFLERVESLDPRQWALVLRSWRLLLAYQDGTLPRTGRKAQRALVREGLEERLRRARGALRVPEPDGRLMAALAAAGPEQPPAEAEVGDLLRDAASSALLALLARRRLRGPEFEFLYLAFQSVIPAEELGP